MVDFSPIYNFKNQMSKYILVQDNLANNQKGNE